jgi:hypothetical protein
MIFDEENSLYLRVMTDMSKISDFSDVENIPEAADEIQKLVGQAGTAAASEAKAVGIPKVFERNNQIVKEFEDGRVVIIAEGNAERTYFKQVKHKILHARSK